MAISDDILKRLLSLHPKLIDLSLDRMHRILERLGNPQGKLPPVIHVAGTNGKGSTVAYLRAITEAAGLRIHTYTSPHLVKFHERIRLASSGGISSFISEDFLSQLLAECEKANGAEPITFFEITTAAAMLAFSRTPADYTLVEVGLGGRLDATNVITNPKISVITTIDYDHQQYLGDTLAKIAYEKSGIIKPKVPCIVGAQPDEALLVIEKTAQRLHSPLRISGQDWQAYEDQGRLIYQDAVRLFDLPLPHLHGRFQIDNAGNAIATLCTLADDRVADEHFIRGMKTVDWPARMQMLGPGALLSELKKDQEFWLDGAHNPSGGKAVAQSFADLNRHSPRPFVLVLGMLATKDVRGFIRAFRGVAAKIITLTIPGEENAISAEVLAQYAKEDGLDASSAPSIVSALRQAASFDPRARILVTGSLYLAGHVISLHTGNALSAVSGAARR